MLGEDGHDATGPLREEGAGPLPPVGGQVGRAVEEAFFEDSTTADARHPPLVRGASIGAVALHGNRRDLGDQPNEIMALNTVGIELQTLDGYLDVNITVNTHTQHTYPRCGCEQELGRERGLARPQSGGGRTSTVDGCVGVPDHAGPEGREDQVLKHKHKVLISMWGGGGC